MVTRKAKSPFAAAAQQQQGALLWTDVINSKLKELKEKRSKSISTAFMKFDLWHLSIFLNSTTLLLYLF